VDKFKAFLTGCSILVIIILSGGNPFSKEASSSSSSKKVKHKMVNLKANSVKYNNKTKNVLATGKVVMTTEDMKLTCDWALYNTENKTAILKNNLKLTQTGTELSGDLLTADFKEKRVVIEKNVRLIQEKKEIKKESGLKEHLKEKFTLTCGRIEYFYGEKRGVAEGNIKVSQEDSTAYGDEAVYTDKDEQIVVTGKVRVEQKNGEWLTCKRAVISTKEDWVEAEGEVEGTIKVEEEEFPETKF